MYLAPKPHFFAMPNTLDLLLDPPDFAARATLEIGALAPLSLVARMPGKYYQSQSKPTDAMLYGLLENALGWHLEEPERRKLFERLKKQHKRKDALPSWTGGNFLSLLQWHVRFGLVVVPALLHYDDLWTQHLKGKTFPDGSRNYDKQAIPIMNAKRAKRVTFSDAAGADKNPAKLTDFDDKDEVHLNVLRPYFPQYYSSPTLRGYVVPDGPYRIVVETTAALAQVLAAAVADPAAPLYLGSNDGWVEATWQPIDQTR
jgi:CRISPR-associated protein Cas5